MATYLSPDWFALQQELADDLPERPGVSARLQVVISGTPDGEVRYHQTVGDGRVVDLGLGDDPDAEVTLTQTYADSVAIAKGEVGSAAAFMQGRVKVVGPMGKVMALMPLLESDEYRAALAALAAQTDY